MYHLSTVKMISIVINLLWGQTLEYYLLLIVLYRINVVIYCHCFLSCYPIPCLELTNVEGVVEIHEVRSPYLSCLRRNLYLAFQILL